MLRRNKSIFHLGGDDAEEEEKEEEDDQKHKKERESFVGLQILIQHHSQTSNIVTKHTLKAPQVHKIPSAFGFLSSCHLCKRKLSPQKDVYMYRGDQGYCSPECRNRQMILDERRELEVSSNEPVISVPHHHELGLKIKDSDHQNKISAAA